MISSHNAGFGYMITLFIHIFVLCAFRTVTHYAQRLKVVAFGLYNIAVVYVNGRLLWNELLNKTEVLNFFEIFSRRT
jgi:hypothetical protein